MKPIILSILFACTLAVPMFASAAFNQTWNTGYSTGFLSSSGGYGGPGNCTNGSGIECIAFTILYIINYVLVPLLFAVAFIVFLYGIAKTYIFSRGESAEVEDGHRLILWGIIGFVVMISLWGLVNVVANTFGLYGASVPVPPTSIYQS